MTGGRVVVLGKTGRNFAAGMSGGIAYVYDEDGTFERRCNLSMVDLEPVIEPEAVQELQEMIQHHVTYTESTVGQRILADWDESLSRFVRVMPKEYRRYLLEKAVQAAEQEESLELTEVSHG